MAGNLSDIVQVTVQQSGSVTALFGDWYCLPEVPHMNPPISIDNLRWWLSWNNVFADFYQIYGHDSQHLDRGWAE